MQVGPMHYTTVTTKNHLRSTAYGPSMARLLNAARTSFGPPGIMQMRRPGNVPGNVPTHKVFISPMHLILIVHGNVSSINDKTPNSDQQLVSQIPSTSSAPSDTARTECEYASSAIDLV